MFLRFSPEILSFAGFFIRLNLGSFEGHHNDQLVVGSSFTCLVRVEEVVFELIENFKVRRRRTFDLVFRLIHGTTA